jgi:hypothetical protein
MCVVSFLKATKVTTSVSLFCHTVLCKVHSCETQTDNLQILLITIQIQILIECTKKVCCTYYELCFSLSNGKVFFVILGKLYVEIKLVGLNSGTAEKQR